MTEFTPLHHLSGEEFSTHLTEKYGALPVDATPSMDDSSWEAYQESRFPGTQAIVEGRRHLQTELERFVEPGTPLSALFNRFDPSLETETDPARRLEKYEQVCVDNFDFRKGPNGEIRERQDVAEVLLQSREEVGEELWDAAFAACDALGMVESSVLSPHDQLASIGVLGGTASAVENRTRYGIEQLEKHGATTDTFDFLMSEQEVGFALKEIERMGAPEEISREERPDGTAIVFAPVTIAGRSVTPRLLIGKATNGRTRATTLDTMKLWNDIAQPTPDKRLVAATTGMYTAFQHANAQEVITWANGAKIDVIGHSAEWAGNRRTANQLLQELKATVDSRWRLQQKMAEHDAYITQQVYSN